MKTVVLFSSIFFLLGLKLGNILNLPGKADAVDKIITNKIIQSKPIKALPLFNDSETETEEKEKEGTEKQETTTQSQTGNTN
ncbi:MAG: hypothetical protein V2I31_03865 [Mariniphaga sp.]|jgi:hypothetical protein|nr:hypothetical protein [Mariniphaga sp.]